MLPEIRYWSSISSVGLKYGEGVNMETIHAITEGIANAYVVNDKGGIMVVDPGSRGAALAVVDYCTNILGASPQESIKIIAMTHYHIDHIGGIATLLEHCGPDTMVIATGYARDYMVHKRKFSSMHNWASCMQTAFYCLKGDAPPAFHSYDSLAGIPEFANLSIPVDSSRFKFYENGFDGTIGFGDWLILPTPGHTEDSVSFYSPAAMALICGDFILNVEPGLFPCGKINGFHSDYIAIHSSLKYLNKNINVAALYPGHGDVVMRQAGSNESILRSVGGLASIFS